MEDVLIDVGDVDLHVGVTGEGPDVVVLSGGPGLEHYLRQDDLAPRGFRCWYPAPRGVGRSGGGPHTMRQALDDLETIRALLGAASWLVLGHSWGADLAVRYALDHAAAVRGVVAVAGRGPQRDSTWSGCYEAGRAGEITPEIAGETGVHEALSASFTEWIHEPGLWRRLADCSVPVRLVAAGDDIRPSWPLAQLAALVPGASLSRVPGVPHNFWHTHPEVWTQVVTEACRSLAD